jgi:hypothetical protein
VARVEPERRHRRFVYVDGPAWRSRIVATLDDEHRGLDVLRVGDGRAGRLTLGLLLRRAAEARGAHAAERFRRVFVRDRPVGHGDAGHAAGPERRPRAERLQREVAAVGSAGHEHARRIRDPCLHEPFAGGDHVFDFPPAEVAPDLLEESTTERRRAAIVDGQEREALVDSRLAGGQVVIGHRELGPAVGVQDRREGAFPIWRREPSLGSAVHPPKETRWIATDGLRGHQAR